MLKVTSSGYFAGEFVNVLQSEHPAVVTSTIYFNEVKTIHEMAKFTHANPTL
ncbi:MAG: hypothetical protein M3250_03315 [Thermoproteota archaeon]|nr:hypothetical protein [Thermoproteota archaeon]